MEFVYLTVRSVITPLERRFCQYQVDVSLVAFGSGGKKRCPVVKSVVNPKIILTHMCMAKALADMD